MVVLRTAQIREATGLFSPNLHKELILPAAERRHRRARCGITLWQRSRRGKAFRVEITETATQNIRATQELWILFSHHICTLGSRTERCSPSPACCQYRKTALRCRRWSYCILRKQNAMGWQMAASNPNIGQVKKNSNTFHH